MHIGNAGIVLLIVLAVPILFQVVKLAIDQKKRHDEVVERLERLERSAR
jgi:hypothetical protein